MARLARAPLLLLLVGLSMVGYGLAVAHLPARVAVSGTVAGAAWIGLRLLPPAPKKYADWTLAGLSVRGLTALATLLAGRMGPALRAECRAHLAGESGHDPVTWRKVKEALGFVASAIQCRLADAVAVAWTPGDAVLKSRRLSNLFVFAPTAVVSLFILHHEGTLGVLTSAESISAIGGGLYGLIRVGRWWRDVKPPEPKARRVKE